jgi:hypothetical protein
MYNENKPTAAVTRLFVDKSSKFYHLFNFLSREYDNDLEKMMRRVGSMATIGLFTRFIKNEKWKKRIQLCQGLISAGLFTTDFIMHVKSYRKSLKEEQNSVHDKRMLKVCKILGINEHHAYYGDVPYVELHINSDIISWMLNRPNTKKFKILNYYNVETGEEIVVNTSEQQIQVGILISFDNKKVLWDLDIKVVSGVYYTKNSFILGEPFREGFDSDYKNFFRKMIISDYINSLDTKRNALFFDTWGYIVTKPRRKVEENINQYDTAALITEIKEVLDKKRRRAYAFVGRQGVGKSAILRKIEEDITEYIIIHLTPSDFDSGSDLKDRFSIIKSLQPAIVIIEDLDACGMKEKNKITGDFLNCIDEINKDLNIVLVVSINDTSSVHYTILNRPGRFDRVEEIKSPQNINEIKEVMFSKIKSIKHNYCNEKIVDENLLKDKGLEQTLNKCLSLQFTQAEITNAIIEQAFIDLSIDMKSGKVQKKWSEISCKKFTEYINRAVGKHLKTKEALKHCNFNNQNPEDNLKMCEAPGAEGIGLRSYGDNFSNRPSFRSRDYEFRHKKF